ncbi:LLM class flavin-dependent oxidoreductase [Streptomyces durbertensis]|uniref:LLM class flavin-dependent oxidoreductase n=1 Tax=Streptomyces durbertensis TaxID=2448886 RepID=A0ABR6EE40_9ACTN|nr:LLM class flavin-dependent oxidoreductase [Streptomyces durbertensis]MBB1243609.1 LLM class flavin-dependent oxidoreductase [Streptomyces durbertensis]
MEFGVNFFPVVDPERKSAADYYEESLRLVDLAEELGYEHVQIVEHYGSPYGGYSPDPVAFLAAAAARTERIRLATGAVIAAFTHPVKLAASLAMLDNLSRGRLDVGFGRAFLPDEFEAFGVSIEESRDRFDDGVAACLELWTGEQTVFEGAVHRFGPFTGYPRPYQRPHPPVFVASATSPDSCAAAGRAGHNLQVVPSVTSREGLRDMIEGYRRARAEAGHPGGGRVQVKYTCYLSEDRELALSDARAQEENYVARMADAVASWAHTRSSQYPGYEKFVEKARAYDFDKALADGKVLAGTPGDVVEQVARVAGEYGGDLCVSLQFNPGHLPYERAARAMGLFAREVAPSFTGMPRTRREPVPATA